MDRKWHDKIRDSLWIIGLSLLFAGLALFGVYVFCGLLSTIYELLIGVIK